MNNQKKKKSTEESILHIKLNKDEEIKFDFSQIKPSKNLPKFSKDDLVAKSAACLIPDESLWEPIQEIRKKYDKSYPRWMPHVNLLYPFIVDDLFENHTKEFISEKLKK